MVGYCNTVGWLSAPTEFEGEYVVVVAIVGSLTIGSCVVNPLLG